MSAVSWEVIIKIKNKKLKNNIPQLLYKSIEIKGIKKKQNITCNILIKYYNNNNNNNNYLKKK